MKLVRNVAYLSLVWLTTTCFSTIYWIIAGKTLSPSSYGIVSVTLQLAMLISTFLFLGFPSALSCLIPKLISQGKRKELQGIINHVFKLELLLLLLTSTILLLLSPLLVKTLNISSESVYLSILIIAIYVLSTMTYHVCYGRQLMKQLFLTTLANNVAKVVLSIALILLFLLDYLGPLIGVFAGYLIALVLRLKYIRVSETSSFGKREKKTLFKYSLPPFTVSVLQNLYSNTNLILLNTLTSSFVTGIFSLATRLAMFTQAIPPLVFRGVFPEISYLSGKPSQRSRQSYLISLSLRYAILILLPLSFLLLFLSKYLILIFATEKYLEATSFLPLLVLSFGLQSLGAICISSLYAIGKPKEYLLCYLYLTVPYLALAPPLTYLYSAKGMVLAMLVASTSYFSKSFLTLRKRVDLKLRAREVGQMLFSGVIAFLPPLILQRALLLSLLHAAALSLTSLLAYLLILFFANFFVKEDLKPLRILADRVNVGLLKKAVNFLERRIRKSYYEGRDQ